MAIRSMVKKSRYAVSELSLIAKLKEKGKWPFPSRDIYGNIIPVVKVSKIRKPYTPRHFRVPSSGEKSFAKILSKFGDASF